MTGWAVVDVETTGLNPARDRVVEIAVVRLAGDGRPVDEWSTLVNPGDRRRRPVPKTGLTNDDLEGAPAFPLILNDLLARLAGNVLVAHNAPFDVAFLHAETVRAGIPWGPVEGFCTMDVLAQLGLTKRRDLHGACADLGVAADRAHVALNDARAAAGLIGYLGPRLWSIESPLPAPYWAQPRAPAPIVNRAIDAPAVPESLAAPLRGVRIPEGLGVREGAAVTYLGLLDLVVDDGVVTESECDALSVFADACGIDRGIARQLHNAYLNEMSRVAAEDGIVTDDERRELERLMVLLGQALPR